MSQLRVYFDSHCRLCDAEMNWYRRMDREGHIQFVDIMDPQFQAEAEGLDPARVHQLFHVRRSDGQLLVGVDGFVAIWSVLPGFSWLTRAASVRGVRFALDLGYQGFVKIRPYLPRKEKCEDDHCNLTPQ